MGKMKVAVCILSIYRCICGGFYAGSCMSVREQAPHILKTEPNQSSHLTERQS